MGDFSHHTQAGIRRSTRYHRPTMTTTSTTQDPEALRRLATEQARALRTEASSKADQLLTEATAKDAAARQLENQARNADLCRLLSTVLGVPIVEVTHTLDLGAHSVGWTITAADGTRLDGDAAARVVRHVSNVQASTANARDAWASGIPGYNRPTGFCPLGVRRV